MLKFIQNLSRIFIEQSSVLLRPINNYSRAFFEYKFPSMYLRIFLAVCSIIVIYYLGGMIWYNKIDDNLEFSIDNNVLAPGASQAVFVTAELVTRESTRWAANKPLIHPASGLDNMPNYQLGIIYAASRFVIELGDSLGRTRGSSNIDPDLDMAGGLLKYDGTIWYWGSGNLVPTATSDSQYKKAVKALLSYNGRLSSGTATYEKRADNLIAFLSRVTSDLGASSAALAEQINKSNAGYFDRRADDIFYNVKGRLYGYAIILREIGVDFRSVISEKQAIGIWDQMIKSLSIGAEMEPFIVANGNRASLVVPSHLSELGFFLLRARTQIKELIDSLEK